LYLPLARGENADQERSVVALVFQATSRNNVIATSSLVRNACLIAGQLFSRRNRVFHEYRCFGLWKSLLAT
jgi:hypothetical protein